MSGFPGDDFYGETTIERGDELRDDGPQPIVALACPVLMDLEIDYPEIPDPEPGADVF